MSAPRSRSTTRRAAPVFAALGDETRLGLVQRLSGAGPMSIARLTEATEVTRQAVTKHLHVLEAAGLVRSARAGRESVWELTPAPLVDARGYLDQIAAQWDDVLARLRAFVEEG
jgi:DNA-binding transcriptional ArsR family regulator